MALSMNWMPPSHPTGTGSPMPPMNPEILRWTSGDSFRSGTAQPWSTVQITDRGPAANFDVHPDGKRMLVLKAPKDREAVSDNKLSFFFNFFDELRGKAPPAKN